VKITQAQLSALCRINREFNVVEVTLEPYNDEVADVTVVMKGGNQLFAKQILLARDGKRYEASASTAQDSAR
jgi:hypothetical protein